MKADKFNLKNLPFFSNTLQEIKDRNEDLAREVQLLKQKLEELEELARGRGLAGIFNFRHAHAHASDERKTTPN